MLKNNHLQILAASRLMATGKAADMALFAALDKELQKPDLRPTDAELVDLSDMMDMTFGGGKSCFQEEGDVREVLVVFARAVLCKYGQHRARQPLSEADLTRIDKSEKPLIQRMRKVAQDHEQGGGASMLLNEGADALEEAASLIVALQAELAHQIGT